MEDREYYAVSFTTLHRDKNPVWLFEANYTLPDDRKIDIWGNFVGNPYWFWGGLPDHLKMQWDIDAKTAPNYHGKLSADDTTQAIEIASNAIFSFDLMNRKMAMSDMYDGGDLETVGLEALWGGSILIMHRNWVGHPESRLVPGENCLVVSNPTDIVEILSYANPRDYWHIAQAAHELLSAHMPNVVVQQYVEYLEGLR